jgi:transposase
MIDNDTKTKFINSLAGTGKKPKFRKLLLAERKQYKMDYSCLEDLIDEDHRVRSIWNYVELLNLNQILENVQTYQGSVGRPAIDPKILLTLWLYATVEGFGSAYQLEKQCNENIAYKWICGGVTVGRKTLSEFRVNYSTVLESILVNGITALIKANIVYLEEVSHDGLKVRASASEKSLKKHKSINDIKTIVEDHINRLRHEIEENPLEAVETRKKMKLQRLVEKRKRLEEACKEVEKYSEQKDQTRVKARKKKLTGDEKEEIKVSITDTKARIMKMPQGGYKLAYNCGFVMDTKSGMIVGANATNNASDAGQIKHMFDYLNDKYTRAPNRYLADSGFRKNSDVQALYESGCEVYMPVPEREKQISVDQPVGVTLWKERMNLADSKKIYSRRASTIEWFNAGARLRGLHRFSVRGLKKIQGICILHALAHNLERMRSLKLI